MSPPAYDTLTLSPIGVVRSPFNERVSAPRQPYAAEGVSGRIELFPIEGFEHALADIDTWDRLWVIFWFHQNEGWRPKVLPPRAKRRVGLFATRSPYRPNPIGLSVVRLARVEGLTLHVTDLDMLDGTPVLDIKPYVPVADAHPDAKSGWLGRDPVPPWRVVWEPGAEAQASWLRDEHGIDLVTPVERALALGPAPHPYRRIKRHGDAMQLAVKDWRARFRVEDRSAVVLSIATGYRERQLATSESPALAVHRAFVTRFGSVALARAAAGAADAPEPVPR